ncbi:MAG: F0F1 ATP synthase subunit delta, partial [Acidimicrobiia bacterium]|nr:F0F1 ATP synthase subunit delta [Acidimicrobiia bacterium]
MASTDRIDGYADALLAVASAEGESDAVSQELARIGGAIESSPDLADALGDQTVPLERRLGIVRDLVGGKVSPTTLHLASMVVSLGHGADLADIAERMSARAAGRRGAAVAEIRSADPLDDDTLERIAAALAQRV